MTSNMQGIQLNTEYKDAVRFPAWIALAVFSAICMAAFASEVKKDDRESEERWCLAVYVISLCLATLASVAYMLVRGIFVGQIFEAGMVALLLAFWGIGLPVIMKPDNGIAVAGDVVLNANLYFFSWGAFAVTIFLTLSLFQETMGIDVRQTPGKQANWFFLAASSLVVMGSAVRIYKSEAVECGDDDGELHGSDFCKRTTYALSMGTITFAIGIMVLGMLMKKLMATMMELGVTVILLVLWTFGVGFITFGGSKAPGATIGNLFFSTWISFILCVMLFANSLQEFIGGSAAAEASSGTTTQDDVEEHQENNTAPAVTHEEDF